MLLDTFGLATSKLLLALFGHRNFLHWALLAVLFIGCGIFFAFGPLIWFGWGYLLHVLADSCTRRGVPLLAPFFRRRFCLLPLRTGSWPESGWAVCLWVYTVNEGYALMSDEDMSHVAGEVVELYASYSTHLAIGRREGD